MVNQYEEGKIEERGGSQLDQRAFNPASPIRSSLCTLDLTFFSSLIFVSVNTPTKKSGIGAGFAADLK